MNCEDVRKAMDARFDAGEKLDEGLAAHAAACAGCAGHWQALAALAATLEGLPGETPPPELEHKVRRALERERARSRRWRFAGLAAAVLLALALGFAYPLDTTPAAWETLAARGVETPAWLKALQTPPALLLDYPTWGNAWLDEAEAALEETLGWLEPASLTPWQMLAVVLGALALLAGANAVAARRIDPHRS